MATILLVAITLVAGAALFGYVNGQAAVSESLLGGQFQNNIIALQEKEVITFVSFPSSHTDAYVWIYNTGKVDLSDFSLIITGPMCSALQGASCAIPTIATFTCLYSGSCTWVMGSSSGTCGTISPPNTPIPASTSSSPSTPQTYQISLASGGAPCSGGAPLYFDNTASPPPYSYGFIVVFQGQYGSQVQVTEAN
jgi:hypothetical protein